jgi:hypothetical protein
MANEFKGVDVKRGRQVRLTYANVVASVALFVALGGSSYAAVSITGKEVRDGSLTGRDVRDGSLTSRDVRNHSLLARNFKAGQLPRGPTGNPGPPGTPNGYTKAEADGRFLPLNGKAADANTLDGIHANGFVQGGGEVTFRQTLLDQNQAITNWMAVNGEAHLQVSCAPGSQGIVRLVNDSSGVVHAFANSVINTSAQMAEYGLQHQGDGVNVLVETFDSQETLQVLTGTPTSTQLTTLVISALHDVDGGCRFVAHSIQSSSSDPLT